jgi:hypothetical protein
VEQATHEAQIKKAVALDKARGVFLTTIQRRRFLQWREKNREEEVLEMSFNDGKFPPTADDWKSPRRFQRSGTYLPTYRNVSFLII